MYARREKQMPFRPSASFKGLDKPVPKFERPKPVDPDDDYRVKKQRVKDFPTMVDAETGEPLDYTKATWTAKEGRLSLTARTIIDMGTGRLDISNQQRHNSAAISVCTESPMRHELLDKFLADGPITPMFHVHWNPLKDKVEHPNIAKFGLLSADEIPVAEDDTAASPSLYSRSVNPPVIEVTEVHKHEQSPTHHGMHVPLQVAEKFLVPSNVDLSNTRNWERLHDQTYKELLEIALGMERNKSMTKEEATPGGAAAIRRTCANLANMRITQLRQMVQAVDDEGAREQARDSAERANFDKPEMLLSLKRQHREQRKSGKLYLDALQRDQEIVFLFKLREVGLFW